MSCSSGAVSSTTKRKYSGDESDLDERDDTKRKNRNLSEKKRRDIFNKLIGELNSMVRKSSKKMDKSAVLQASIAYLRHFKERPQNIVDEKTLDRSWFPEFLSQNDFCRAMLESQDAFTLCVSYKGIIMYVSNAVASVLGYVPQYLRSAIFSIVHEDDHPDVYSLLKTASGPDIASLRDSNVAFTIVLHMRWGPLRTPPSGQTAVYEPFKLVGYFRNYTEGPSVSVQGKDRWHPCFVAVALPLRLGQITRELMVPDDSTLEFISRHNMEWKFVLLDNRAADIIGYLPFEIIGTSGYNYYHVEDLTRIVQGHRSLLQTGEGTSCHYRFLTKGQQWLWLQTRYYISYQQWNSRPEHIVCTHRVLSYSERDAALKAARCSISSGPSGASGGSAVGTLPASEPSAGPSGASMNCADLFDKTPSYSINGADGLDLVDRGSDKDMAAWGGHSQSASTVSTPLSTPRSYGSSYSCSSRGSTSPNSSEQSCNVSSYKSSRSLSENSFTDDSPFLLPLTESWLLSGTSDMDEVHTKLEPDSVFELHGCKSAPGESIAVPGPSTLSFHSTPEACRVAHPPTPAERNLKKRQRQLQNQILRQQRELATISQQLEQSEQEPHSSYSNTIDRIQSQPMPMNSGNQNTFWESGSTNAQNHHHMLINTEGVALSERFNVPSVQSFGGVLHEAASHLFPLQDETFFSPDFSLSSSDNSYIEDES